MISDLKSTLCFVLIMTARQLRLCELFLTYTFSTGNIGIYKADLKEVGLVLCFISVCAEENILIVTGLFDEGNDR